MTQTNETKKLEILVVEDMQKHIDNAVKLREEGHSVEVAQNYQSAVLKIKEKKYGVVLTDLFFPWSGGADYPLNPDDRKHQKEAISPQALGYPLAIVAIAAGVQYVGIVTDANHHTGVMAATTDQLAPHSEGYCRLIPGSDGPQLRMFKSEKKDWSWALRLLTHAEEEEKKELEKGRAYDPDYNGLPEFREILQL